MVCPVTNESASETTTCSTTLEKAGVAALPAPELLLFTRETYQYRLTGTLTLINCQSPRVSLL